MLDRASTFADLEIVRMLKSDFVPVAIDQAYQRRQKDSEGEFYRKIASQSPRNNFQSTTQGFFVATPSGKLLFYNNNRDPAKVRRLMKDALKTFASNAEAKSPVKIIEGKSKDERYNVSPPESGLVIRVHAKVLGGYEPTDDKWLNIFQAALSRDNLWLTAAEHTQLASGTLPESVKRRIAKYHLVDNTRGEPPMWSDKEIRKLDVQLKPSDAAASKLLGKVQLETKSGDRGYDAEIKGYVESKAGKVTRFDLVALGEFWGDGPFTSRGPKGRFPLAISFSLADQTDVADRVPPQGSRGWVDGYLR